MSDDQRPLELVHSQSAFDVAKNQMFDRWARREFVYGTWERVLVARRHLLEACYDHPDIPPTDIEGRMRQLQMDITDALSAQSVYRKVDVHLDVIRRHLVGLEAALHVGLMTEATDEHRELAARNCEAHLYGLVDHLRSSGVATHMERLDAWMYEHARVQAEHADLMRLAFAEMNEGRIGCMGPRVFVLPSRSHAFNPLLLLADDDVVFPESVARDLRLLFSR